LGLTFPRLVSCRKIILPDEYNKRQNYTTRKKTEKTTVMELPNRKDAKVQ
jgi:hypothetical protein